MILQSGSSKEKNVEKIELKERLRVPTSEDENADEMSTLSRVICISYRALIPN